MKITHIVEGSRPQKPKPYNSNPVAKNIDKFNKPATHRDRKNDYKRKPKFGNKDLDASIEEAKGLGKRVKVVKGRFAGQEGTIRQIKHGAFKGAPKSYYIDLDNGEMADNLPADVIRLIKRAEEAASVDPKVAKAVEAVDKYTSFSTQNKNRKPSLSQNKLSSAEYQKVKKLKSFNKDDWKWNGDLYIRVEKAVSEGDFDTIQKKTTAEGEKHGNSKVYDQCWDGYKKVPGKSRGEKGSCVKETDLSEGPLVIRGESDLIKMLDTLLSSWKDKSHSKEEYTELLHALGYSIEFDGAKATLVKEEVTESIRGVLGAAALIAALWGVNNHMAQQAYDASPQLQKLTAYLEVAKEHNDQRMIDQLESRIENHKTRLDIGKGDVMDNDGKPIDVVYDKKRGRNI